MPRDQRDSDWVRRFYAVIGDAGMTTTSDQVLQGPDGFSYFVLNMPAPNRDIQPLSLAQVLDFCLENSLGVVIEAQPEPPERVIPFGRLWSKKELGKFDPKLEPDPESETAIEVRSPEVPSHLAGKPAVLVGQHEVIQGSECLRQTFNRHVPAPSDLEKASNCFNASPQTA